MIHTIAHSWKKLVAPVAFLAFFLLLGINQATAQSIQRHGSGNPKATLAQNFGVTARNLGTWTPDHVIQVLTANRPAVKGQDNAPLNSRVTYDYYQMVIADVKNLSIAPEIALLTNLLKVQKLYKVTPVGENNAYFANLYNTTVTLF